MGQAYLDQAKQGKNSWWRYVLGVMLIAFFWLLIGGIVAAAAAIAWLDSQSTPLEKLLPTTEQALLQVLQSPTLEAYVINNLPFLCFYGGLFAVMCWLHQRPVKSLLSVDGTFKIARFARGFGLWFLLLGLPSLIDYAFNTESYQRIPLLTNWLQFLPFALVLTPFQVAAEELLFRGYLLQGLGLISRNSFFLICVNGGLFALPHLANPELQRGAVWLILIYFAIGAFLALVTLKENRLEMALGIHAANNILVVVFVNSVDSAVPAPTLLTAQETGDPRLTLLLLLGQMLVFYYLCFGRRRGKPVSGSKQ
ncbi:MAG: CPBP family intramembrane metalloprotease [Leptolyngbyaceae cyanobacterium SM1_1_3]|nr:CPBP family intramembrane metalloprotease [Leptolyngbyaceae cyanobacterium SM1_1_3]NJM85237.1 CPBP family intramembrane metalloprotease [Leptolyngbyaceae cyanobacterium RM2_2_21]NJN04307.1 CPBP family intramembrane metalloprotease [Leptolyngbyaceae cyanobacterium RM1_1_2]NJO10414.1 CPBP family intramembrane metalloprotease [Leptolyngbyaceae cyanobacterium SL_1_1]